VGSGGSGSVGVGGSSRSSLSDIGAVLLVSSKCIRLSLICFLVLPGRNSRISEVYAPISSEASVESEEKVRLLLRPHGGSSPGPTGGHLGRFSAPSVPEFRVCVSLVLGAACGCAEGVRAQLVLEGQSWPGRPLALGNVTLRGVYLLEALAASGASPRDAHASILLSRVTVELSESQEQHTLVSACAGLALDALCRHR